MKIWKKIATGALCLCLIVPAAFAEETAEGTDAITSATQQQDSSDRGGRQQAPDQSRQKQPRNSGTQNGQTPDQNSRTDQNKQHRQKPGQNTQTTNEQTQSSQNVQTPDPNGQLPGTGSQAEQQNKKAGKTNRKGKKAEIQSTGPQEDNSQLTPPEKPEEEAAVSSDETLKGILSDLESRIKELKDLLEAMIQNTASDSGN